MLITGIICLEKKKSIQKTKIVLYFFNFLEGGGIMVWGAFGINVVLELKKINTTIDSIGYQEILNASLNDEIYNVVQNRNEKIFFQQDNYSIHTSKSTTAFLKKQKKYQILEWPSRSLDLNLIENIWGPFNVQNIWKWSKILQP